MRRGCYVVAGIAAVVLQIAMWCNPSEPYLERLVLHVFVSFFNDDPEV